jgi:hypothetical protein
LSDSTAARWIGAKLSTLAEENGVRLERGRNVKWTKNGRLEIRMPLLALSRRN